MPIYMNFNNLGIKGNVTAEGHQDWIELNSCQWGVGRGISSPTGASADRESSAPSVSEVVVTKQWEFSSPLLIQEALQGEGVVVVIHFTKTAQGKLENYIEFTLTNTMISGYSASSGGDAPSESLSLNFTKVEVKHVGSDIQGKAGGEPVVVNYDLALAKIV
ncbi:MAG: type VI secretion system tube protein Hcp [Planctomycetes bacterium]|nr:type VI secretion system tube protein Hcp [Planctomycetota bacterium]